MRVAFSALQHSAVLVANALHDDASGLDVEAAAGARCNAAHVTTGLQALGHVGLYQTPVAKPFTHLARM
jgi:hypothetical protein